MSQEQTTSINEGSSACRLCGQLKEQMRGAVCPDCVKETLLKHLSLLKRTLEARYGSALDQWLASGRFQGARWAAGVDAQISRERLASFVREEVRDAVARGEVGIILSGDDQSWKPIQINELMDSIYGLCEEEFRRFIESLLKAINNAPTREVERELIEVVSGKKRVKKRYLREEAISAVMSSDGVPLPPQAKALIELRYRADGGRASYASVEDGEISSVWKEIGEALPEEIVRLICDDNSLYGCRY